jgi:SSS family solute:Na+ symporter
VPCLAALVWIDWLVVGAYGAMVIGVAAWAKRRQHSSEDYLMGGRALPWWLIGMSIIATAFSTISLLSWTGKGYNDGLCWFQLQAGELAAILVVCVVFLPFFAGLDLTTAYQVLERRLGPRARVIASALFHLAVLARGGLFLFLTARALHVFAPIDIGTSILVVGALAMAYSAVGGLGAVVWTDGVQLLLVLGGVAACIAVILSRVPDGLHGVLQAAAARPVVDFHPDPGRFPGFWSGLMGYGLLALSVAGTNQQSVQRYMACRDLRAARRAALLSWALGALIVLLTLGMGVGLKALWGDRPLATDDVFTTFVKEGLPAGLGGVVVAAVFAASMSSIDSTVHSMATASLVDFVERFRREPLGDRARLRWARTFTLVYGVLAVAAAFYAMHQGRDVIYLLLKWLGDLAGPVLALFLLAMLTRRVREAHALVGLACGYAVVLLGFTSLGARLLGRTGAAPTLAASLGLNWIWSACAGCVVTIGVALLLALASRAGNVRNPT